MNLETHRGGTTKKAVFIIVGAATVVGALAYGGMQYHQAAKEVRATKLSKELRLFLAPTVTIDDVSYEIIDGQVQKKEKKDEDEQDTPVELSVQLRVLQIAYFSLQTRLHPLFALPDTSLEALQENIVALESAVDVFAPYLNSIQEQAVRENLFPTQFLKEVIELESLRRLIVKAPRADHIETYISQFERTLDALEDDLSQFEEALEAASENQEHDTFHLVGGFVTQEHLGRTFERMHFNLRRARTELQARADCFHSLFSTCSPLNERLYPAIQAHSSVHTPNTDVRSIALRNRSILEDAYENDYTTKERYVENTTIHIEDSGCFPDETNGVYYMQLYRLLENEHFALKTLPLNDLYFYDLENLTNEVGPFERMREYGYAFAFQPPSNTYMCLSASMDAARVQTALSVKKLLERTPVFTKSASEYDLEAFKEAAALETRIVNAQDILYEEDVATYAGLLVQIMRRAEGTAALLEPPFSLSQASVQLMQRVLDVYAAQSAGLQYLLAGIVDENKALYPLPQGGIVLPDLYGMLIARSGYPLLFLTFNKTVHPITPQLYLYEPARNEVFDLTTYGTNERMQREFAPRELSELISEVFFLQRPENSELIPRNLSN